MMTGFLLTVASTVVGPSVLGGRLPVSLVAPGLMVAGLVCGVMLIAVTAPSSRRGRPRASAPAPVPPGRAARPAPGARARSVAGVDGRAADPRTPAGHRPDPGYPAARRAGALSPGRARRQGCGVLPARKPARLLTLVMCRSETSGRNRRTCRCCTSIWTGCATGRRAGWRRRCGRLAVPRRHGPSGTSTRSCTPSGSPSWTRPRTGCASAGSTSTRARPVTSAGWASATRRTTTSRCCSTGAHRPPGRSTWPPRCPRTGSGAVGTSRPCRREVIRLDDEVLDLAAAGQDGLTGGLTGEAALLAALNASRTGQMSDIVETIQVEQDWIIRSPHKGVLVVAGRARHRQDRGRPAPRRVPALHPPRAAGPAGGADRRPEPDLPALCRPGAAFPRRNLGAACPPSPTCTRGSPPAGTSPPPPRGSRAGWRWRR